MSQKAWMTAYTKGSKSLQARLSKIHANNPEFQDFVKKHGFGGNLSVKQSGLQKKSSVTSVKPVDTAPDKNPNIGREAMIKAAAEKIKSRRMAASNRAAFGGELGGSFSMPGSGFRRYSEETHFGDASYTMRRGGWVVKRNGKIASAVLPTETHAKEFINSTRMTLGKKVANVLRTKAKEISKGLGRMSMATESEQNRNRIRSWDSAVLPVEHDHAMSTPHPKKKLDALRASGKHTEARELERSWLKKAMAKAKTEN